LASLYHLEASAFDVQGCPVQDFVSLCILHRFLLCSSLEQCRPARAEKFMYDRPSIPDDTNILHSPSFGITNLNDVPCKSGAKPGPLLRLSFELRGTMGLYQLPA